MDQTSGFYVDMDRIPASNDEQGIKVLHLIYSSESGPFRILRGVYNGRRVAIKCLKEEYSSSTAHIKLLRREGELLATLHHQNIVQVFSVQELDDLGTAIIMEYVDAPTLADFIKSRNISLSKARQLLESICETVCYLHSHGVTHRDLKLENILVIPETEEIKIIDFGLSHGKAFADVPIPGGTHNFSAPEQFEREAGADPSADVWSIGKLMRVIYPAKDCGNAGILLHPSVRAWTLTAKDCMNMDPQTRPASAAVVKSLLERRMKRFGMIRILIVSCTAALITGVLLFPYLFREHIQTPEASLSHSSVSKMPVATNSLPIDTVSAFSASPDSLIDANADMPDNSVADDNAESDINPKSDTEDAVDPYYSNDYVLEEYVHIDGSPRLVRMKLTDPVPRAFVAFLRPTINKYFQWQLNLLKTLTTQDQADLACVGHWQYKVSSDVTAWLNKQRDAKQINKAEYLVLMSFAYEVLDSYIKSHAQEEYNAKINMFKRTGLSFISKWTEKYQGRDDLTLVHEFQQDGKWHEYVTHKNKIDIETFP